ncbi:hypothetical protein CKO28_00450 [Rhodovibrio sodomensis]|uniref:Uncharacterized protein n=1 Tax=Rhodovibrio sodomensis TaxID=1088 RepID=A0ABS1D843_9PROT|nr:hypothetical protein [Rhodovibrio sodomensis]MBK1666510.1 hypothetical protein [Rhodovibrio sodomensis]
MTDVIHLIFPGELIDAASAVLTGTGDPDTGRLPLETRASNAEVEVHGKISPIRHGHVEQQVIVKPAAGGDGRTLGCKTVSLKAPLATSPIGEITTTGVGGKPLQVLICSDHVTLEVPGGQADDIQAILDGDRAADEKAGACLYSYTADFGGGYQADINVVAGGDGELPYIDASLFLNGSELDTLEPDEVLLGEHSFCHDDLTFAVTLIRGRDKTPVVRPTQQAKPARPRPRKSGSAVWI